MRFMTLGSIWNVKGAVFAGAAQRPFDHYSAYCLGKLALIKMTELLDSEYPDLQVSIIGASWVKTKIHHQTLAAGESAGLNFDTTRLWQVPSIPAPHLKLLLNVLIGVYLHLEKQWWQKFFLGSRPLATSQFIEELIANPNSYKLRRLS